MVPKPHPCYIHALALAFADGLVNTTKKADTGDGHGHGDQDETEDGSQNQLFAQTDADIPDDDCGKGENYFEDECMCQRVHKIQKKKKKTTYCTDR